MKKVMGGLDDPNSCCAHTADWATYVSCGLDRQTAIDRADTYASGSGNSCYWCCDNCNS